MDLGPRSPGRLLLAFAVVATLLGKLALVLRHGSSGWDSWLFLERGLTHSAAWNTELAVVLPVLALAVAAVLLRRNTWSPLLLLPAFGYLLAEACLVARMGGVGFAEWAPATHALRYATPLALALLALPLLRPAWASGTETGATWLLRLALASVFASHGGEALLGNPRFVDLIIGSGENLLGWRIGEAQARAALTGIAWIDFAAAALLLVRPLPALLWWMAFWGLITACSRMTAFGWDDYPSVLLRTSHFLVPALLAAMANASDRSRE